MRASKSEETKNKIRQTLAETRQTRKNQDCKVVELKIDESSLSLIQKQKLSSFFYEAKCLYNYLLGLEDIFSFDPKTTEITKLDKDRNVVAIELTELSAAARLAIFTRTKQNIINLSKAKKKGLSIGRLKFKSEVNSIPFPQYGASHYIESKSFFKIGGIRKAFRVRGLHQIPENASFANCTLVKRPSGYYILQTIFLPKEERIKTNKTVGLDFGIKTSITTSDGEKFNVSIKESERLKNLQRKLATQQKRSNNWYKTRASIQKEYETLTNRKKDQANKIVHYLLKEYDTICLQDENLQGWHSEWFGKEVQHSSLGAIKGKLLTKKSRIRLIDRYQPTTKGCHHCGNIVSISLAERTFKCSCGYEEDRDIKSAKTIKALGMGHIEAFQKTPESNQEAAESLVQ